MRVHLPCSALAHVMGHLSFNWEGQRAPTKTVCVWGGVRSGRSIDWAHCVPTRKRHQRR